jgi:hypothetical protein
VFILVLAIGILIGMILAAIAGMGLVAFGVLSLGPAGACPQTPVCPPTAAFLPVCPTCAAALTSEVTAPATPTVTLTPVPPTETAVPATATPDYVATATQACAYFRSRFPGTPCPRFRTPTPVP